MPNRLRKLESSIAQCRNKHAKVGKKAATRAGNIAKSGIRRTHAFSTPVNYTVPGIVPVLQQRDSMGCWATVFTMLASWKNDESTTIPTALSQVGQKWVNMYNNNQGLSGKDKVEFVAASGLIAEPPQNFSVQGWEDLLRTYGPLWVTTDEAAGKAWAIHARVITAINGDGTPAGTSFTIIDPANGRQYKEKISVFVPKYEEEVRRTGYMRIQVLHWSQDARLAASKLSAGSNVVTFQAGNTPTAGVTASSPEPLRNGTAPTVSTPRIVPVNLDTVVRKLIAEGADATALLSFLNDLKAPISADINARPGQALALSGEPGITVTLPTGVELEGAEAIAFRAAVSASLWVLPLTGPLLAALFNALPAIARKFDVTIGIGPSISGGLAGGASFGAGMLFTPDNKIGFYGSAGVVLGAIASISGNLQATVIKGPVKNFGGAATLVGVSIDTGVGAGIGAHAIMANGKFIGVTGEVGVTAGLSPFEAFAEFQYTATSLGLDAYAGQLGGPVLFGIAGLTAVTAVEIGLAGAALLQPLTVSDGGLSVLSDQANRLLDNEARAKLGPKTKRSFAYPLLWVGEIKKGFADALFEVKWEGNEYGEIAGLRVVRNIHKTTTWDKSSLNINFKRLKTLPPVNMGDPREWPIVFEYDGSFDPYGNGHFTFQGQFAANAFGGLKNLSHEISDKSFASFLKMGNKTDYVRKKPDQSYTVAKIPADQLAYVKDKLGL